MAMLQIWVAAAIGEVLFEQEKYKESFDYYEEALYKFYDGKMFVFT